MVSRRDFLKAAGLIALWPYGCVRRSSEHDGIVVNDIHSQLNPTRVNSIIPVNSLEEIQRGMNHARIEGRAICIAGGRHAMGAQQFGTDAILLDTTKLERVLNFDRERGIIEVEAGIQWPELVAYLLRVQENKPQQWGINQKQTGADRLSLGGAIAANIHSRGLRLKPFIQDVESIVLVDANGNARTCSRRENEELFRLVFGGYGLFGIVYALKLRLVPRQKIERIVKVIQIGDLMPAFEQRIADGFLYGDFQFAIDPVSDDFLRKGVFSCYRPVDPATPVPTAQKQLSDENWKELLYLSHADKRLAFQKYTGYYLATSGQIYWTDTHQLSPYFDDYHRALDKRLGVADRATEIITEIYVPRAGLTKFMEAVRDDFRRNKVELIYGTIRLIERDDESFLAWAKESFACIIFNLHTVHTPGGLKHSADAFRRLIDLAIEQGGSYYLTYHKYATRKQVEACYPQFVEFLRLKKRYDPEELFQSDWYGHYKKMFADVL